VFFPLLAAPDCFGKNVVVLAIVVPELELSDVQRQVLFTDLVERADHAALAGVPLDPSLQKLLDDWAANWVGDEGFSDCCQQADYDNDGE